MRKMLKRLPLKTIIILAVVAAGVWGVFWYLPSYLKQLNRPKFRQDEVTRGDIVVYVNSAGTVKPVLSISVGAFVSGPISDLLVDFNDYVWKDEILARIDPRIYLANVARDRALLLTKQQELERVRYELELARRNEQRAVELRKENKNFLSTAEMDQFRYSRLSLEAQLEVAKAFVEQAKASLAKSEADLKYTEIVSPVDGVVIDRKIDQGQTLAAAFQTPELFIVAPDLRTMYIHAAVDEADIGLITRAQQRMLPVQFTVDAYPDDLFSGRIHQIRKNSKTEQNVVTYPVIVEAQNPEIELEPENIAEICRLVPSAAGLLSAPATGLLNCVSGVYPGRYERIPTLYRQYKLKPGMTASISFQVDEARSVLRIPNAALRFYPPRELVHPDDRQILDGITEAIEEQKSTDARRLSADEKAEARRKRNRRHVWVLEGDKLRAVEVRVGLSNNRYTELISGDLHEGQKLVTGLKTGN